METTGPAIEKSLLVEKNSSTLAALLRVCSNETRLKVLCMLVREDLNPTELAIRAQTSTAVMSQHLGLLRSAGLVHVEKKSRSKIYSCKPEIGEILLTTLVKASMLKMG